MVASEHPMLVNPGDGGSRPVPDPTVLTTQLIDRALASEREYTNSQLSIRDERLAGIDMATKLRLEEIQKMVPDVEKKIAYERSLTEERLGSVAQQFLERDTRSERESRDNKVAVDAAFAAQKEAASEQNKSNTLAIDKSEKATIETLNKQADLFKSTTDALSDKIDDVKARLGMIDATLIGMVQHRAGGRETSTDSRAIGAYVMSAVLFMITVGSIILAVLSQTGNP